MPVTRMRFRILIEPEGMEESEHEIEVRNCDRLEAEVAARGVGVLGPMDEAPQHYTTLWLWCAAKRLTVYAGTFAEFKRDLVTFEDMDGDEPVPADPTQPADPITSPSP